MMPTKGKFSSDPAARRKGAANRRVLVLVVVALFIILGFLAYRGAVRFMADIRQKCAFVSIETGIELFDNTFGRYPPSDVNDVTGVSYCGGMKLAEAMMGQDLLGFNPGSIFRADGLDSNTLAPLYTADTAKGRSGLFVPLENANARRLVDVFGRGNTGSFREDIVVMCDVFEKDRPSGTKTGMPILYYRANTSVTLHDANDPDSPQNIYSYRDNQALISLGVPGKVGQRHPLADPRRFYLNTRNTRVSPASQPCRANSYILISAGRDGLYGTADDICNFDWQYRER